MLQFNLQCASKTLVSYVASNTTSCFTHSTYILQVYAEPAGYWRNYYNLFDFTVLFVSVVQEILTSVRFAETELTVFRVVRGMCPCPCSSAPIPKAAEGT